MAASTSRMIWSIFIVVLTGALNNVSGKVKSKPLGQYNVLAAFLNAVIYTTIYGCILLVTNGKRRRFLSSQEKAFLRSNLSDLKREIEPETGLREHLLIVEDMRLRDYCTRWMKPSIFLLFVLIGFMEALGSVMGMMAQAVVAGPLYSLSLQSIIIFSAGIGYVVLGVRYSKTQIIAMNFVVLGSCVSLFSQYHPSSPSQYSYQLPDSIAFDTTLKTLESVSLNIRAPPTFSRIVTYTLIGALSTLPTAISYATKEYLFRAYSRQFRGMTLSIFTIGFLSSLCALFLLPLTLLVAFYIMSVQSLWSNITNGAYCLMGATPSDATVADCAWAPIAYCVYITINMLFNFSLLHTVKHLTSLVTFLIPLPLLDQQDVGMTSLLWVGLIIVLYGLALYQRGS